MVLSWWVNTFADTVTRSEVCVMSHAPSCTCHGRPKYTGWLESGLSPSLKVLWSIHTFVERRTETRSYSEFQLPSAPSVGRQRGKQSAASSKVRLRTITF